MKTTWKMAILCMILFLGALVSVNLRLPFVKEEEKNEYVKEYLDLAKKGTMFTVKEHEDTTMVIINVNVIVGIFTKPL